MADYRTELDNAEEAPPDGGAFEMGYAGDDAADEGYGAGAVRRSDAGLEGGASLDELKDIAEGLPHFANAANRALHAKIQAKKRLIAASSSQALDHQERLQIMGEHLRNVRQELSHAQELLAARQKEVQTEEHLKALTERAVGRMRQEIAALDKRADAVADQISTVQAGIYRGSERLESFRDAMHMAQGDLERWAAARRQKEEDALALDRYTRADELKIRDLSRELERLTATAAERRRELEREATETRARQVEVDKLAADFRALHAERQGLIRQWKESLDAIAARDGEIRGAAERFASAKEAAASRRSRIGEQERSLGAMRGENGDLEAAIYARERAVGAARDELKALGERAARFGEEVELLRANAAAAAGELAAKRSEISSHQAQLEEKRRAVEAARGRFEAMKAQLAQASAQVATTGSALAEKEGYMARESSRVEAAERRLSLLKEQ